MNPNASALDCAERNLPTAFRIDPFSKVETAISSMWLLLIVRRRTGISLPRSLDIGAGVAAVIWSVRSTY